MHNWTLSPPSWRAWAVAAFAVTAVPAQQIRALPPVAATAAPVAQASDEVGVPVEMFENPNLDRYLRRAQSFLDREDFAAAIQVLQDVVEGRTVEVISGADGLQPAPRPDVAPAGTAPRERPAAPTDLDARRSVFSLDGRLYRPVRRLCHELLSRLPPIGIELYRAAYEVAAQEMFDRAVAEGSISALEEVTNRYFVTMPAGRAMVLLADRLMHEGRYRAAVQVLRDLVEVYPAESRQRLGISDVWCRFKIALCLTLAGEAAAAREQALELAQLHPGETLRILGELQAVKDLPASAVFADEMLAAIAAQPTTAAPSWLGPATDELIPVWQFRFANAEPYRDPKRAGTDRNVVFFEEGMQANMMPHASRYGAGTWVAFAKVRSASGAGELEVSFLEHFRLRIVDVESGVVRAQGEGPIEPPAPRDGHPRVRIAASDYGLLRPVDDEQRRYVVVGHSGNTVASALVLKASEVHAYMRDGMHPIWSSAQWREGEDGLADVTFLAAPTVFGERLLLPARRRNAYTLECLDRRTGKPLWHTMLHAGGTPYFKAPGAPVAVQGGVAYVATNAGCIAAVDAFAGDLRWIRRYERTDPLRPPARSKRGSRGEEVQAHSGTQFLQADLPGFVPNDLLVCDGLVILGMCDSEMLLCIDGASGAPVWMVDGASRYAPYGRLRQLVGASGDNLFLVADRGLVCITLHGGLVRWSRDLPHPAIRAADRGRGTVVGDRVVLPGERELLVFSVNGDAPMQRFPLPPFGASREPLGGSFHVVAHGPWLAAGYPGGVEVFSSRPALRELARSTADVVRRAMLLVHAGDVQDAEAALAAALRDANEPAARRAAIGGQLLSLRRERAASMVGDGDASAALVAMDEIEVLLDDRTVRLDWHLARLEICKAAGDMLAYEREQQRLYDRMEGRQ